MNIIKYDNLSSFLRYNNITEIYSLTYELKHKNINPLSLGFRPLQN